MFNWLRRKLELDIMFDRLDSIDINSVDMLRTLDDLHKRMDRIERALALGPSPNPIHDQIAAEFAAAFPPKQPKDDYNIARDRHPKSNLP